MDQKKEQWEQAYKQLTDTLCNMGYPKEFGHIIAKGLGGVKAMQRMTSYLKLAKPRSEEEIVDETCDIQRERCLAQQKGSGIL